MAKALIAWCNLAWPCPSG